MSVGEQSQAILLLTAWLGKPSPGGAKPLSPGEWGRFALWLNDNNCTPADLLDGDTSRVLSGWTDRSITPARVRALMDRSAALGIALERWQRAGLWVMSRSDVDYPSRLKKRLRFDAPPVLFGCGSRRLLSCGGVAVIGSRDISEDDLTFTADFARQVAGQGFSIVSGGARGVDEAAMLGALECEGTVVGILADNLMRASSSSRYRQGLMQGNLVLASPFNPEAGFAAGNAMARNKYVYCLADAAVVMASAEGTGGTWAGATENLKRQWVPLWIRPSRGYAGNAALVDKGARWLPDGPVQVGILLDHGAMASAAGAESLLDGLAASSAVRESSEVLPDVTTAAAADDEPVQDGDVTEGSAADPMASPLQPPAQDVAAALSPDAGFYELFLLRLQSETAATALTIDQLQQRLHMEKGQLNAWLKQAVAEGRAEKLSRPVRYQFRAAEQSSFIL